MKAEELEQLLYEEEGSTLDFKREQYAFVKASDEEKSELLKDILGFVNGWRRAEAFILIGVEDVQGGRGIVRGISDHLPDHSLQQFVNSLTNRPVQFGYEACEIQGKQVGVIRIELQRRPVYLKRDFGKLKKGEVYVRRGSSTDPTKPADPDEIADMGGGQSLGEKEASLVVEFADPDREQCLGEQIIWSAEFCEMPEPDQIPTLSERRPGPIHLPGGHTIHMPDFSAVSMHDRLNPQFYHELANYIFVQGLVRKARLVVTNTGEVPASDVRLELYVVSGSGYEITDESDVPEPPERKKCIVEVAAIRAPKLRSVFRHVGDVNIKRHGHETKIEIECGNLQPGRKVWTDAFCLRIEHSGEVLIKGTVFAANLPQPKTFTLSIKANIQRTSMTVDELVELGDQYDGNDEDA